MMFYDKVKIENLLMKQEIGEWFQKGLLNEAQRVKALQNRQPTYNETNVFIRVGYFILTLIIASCAFGLCMLIFNVDTNFGIFFLFFGLILLFSLYYFISEFEHYQSGVDDALLYYGLSLILAGVFFLLDLPEDNNYLLKIALILFPFLTISAILFVDRLLTGLSLICFFSLFFLLVMKIGEPAKIVMPFLVMMLNGVTYYGSKKFKVKEDLFYWKKCFLVVECLTLLILYASGNYFVVRELSISLFEMQIGPGDDIPLAYMFYAFTFCIPVVYIFRGLKEKDYIQLNIGLLLIAAAVATVRYYHSIMPIEAACVLGGAVLIVLIKASYQYLSRPKHGITAEEDAHSKDDAKESVEANIQANTNAENQALAPQSGFEFEGGKFGGGGASGSY